MSEYFKKMWERKAASEAQKRNWTAIAKSGNDAGTMRLLNKNEIEARALVEAWIDRDFPGGTYHLKSDDNGVNEITF